MQKGNPPPYTTFQLSENNLRLLEELRKPIRECDTDLCMDLIAQGINPDARYLGYTALVDAAQCGYTDIITALLDCGANINLVSDRASMTALMYAARNGKADAVHILLERGADTTKRDSDTIRTAEELARKAQHDDIANMIASYPFRKAAEKGTPRKRKIRHRPNINKGAAP